MDVSAPIASDLGPLLERLRVLGVTVQGFEYDARAFGNYYVDCAGRRGQMRLSRDRGQFLLDGDQEQIRRLGFFRAFDSKDEFIAAVLSYAQSVA